jgi:hypothetical protein
VRAAPDGFIRLGGAGIFPRWPPSDAA